MAAFLLALIYAYAFLPIFIVVQGKKQEVPKQEIEKLTQLRTHSLFAPYIDQDLQNRWWDFGADAYVNTMKHIRLTRNVASQMGWLWSRLAVTPENFQVEVEFKISGDQSHMYGDGIAMWLTTERAQPGPVFGSVDKFNGLGVFIDTYANSRHNYSFPRVVAMWGDGVTSYDQVQDGEPNALGACSAALRRTQVATKLKLTYVRHQYLDVKLHYNWNEWTDCFTIQNITFQTSPYIGFSAMTGDVSDTHDIISVSTSVISAAEISHRASLSSSRHHSNASSWFTFRGLVSLIFFGAVCALGIVAIRTYARQKGGIRLAGMEVMSRSGGLGALGRSSAKRF